MTPTQTQALRALANAASPQALHDACVRFYTAQLAPGDRPWVALYAPGGMSFPQIRQEVELPGAGSWPEFLHVRFPTRDATSGSPAGSLFLVTPTSPTIPLDVGIWWPVAITLRHPVVLFPSGFHAQAQVLPPDTAPVGVYPGCPATLLGVYGVVAMPHALSHLQVTALRAAGVVEVPGFPKLGTSGDLSFRGQPLFRR